MTVTKWRCFLTGWGIADFVDPSGGYSVASPAEEMIIGNNAGEKMILYHRVRSYPDERNYVVVAGYRKPGAVPYEDGTERRFVDIDAIPEGDRPRICVIFADIAPGQDVYFYGG